MNYFYVIDDIVVDPREKDFDFLSHVHRRYGINIKSFRIDRKAVDARHKNKITIRYRIIIETDSKISENKLAAGITPFLHSEPERPLYKKRDKKVLIIGSGPAGLFAALKLIECGFSVCILERGKCVEERAADVELMNSSGILNRESNVLFGEGGAGTWSDGKLTTRINKPGIDWFFSRMVEFGADESISYDSKPHVGSDRLSEILKNIRSYILENGSEINFTEKVTEFICNGNTVCGVRTSNGSEFTGCCTILATGHSARDVYEYLAGINVTLEAKPFAVGCRVEHPREFINHAQYCTFAEVLPAADYRLVYNDRKSGRGIFSFCMCPGGVVINSSSEENALCVNGMSFSGRDLANSNSAVVVSVSRNDLGENPLSGIDFQRKIEQAAYNKTAGPYFAPAIGISSFMSGKASGVSISGSSYMPGVYESDFRTVLPDWILSAMKEGFYAFDRKIKGFISNGIMVGVETRTSSPVRIVRNDRCESVSHEKLYPAGEGAGYAGGIVSSAVDGIRIAEIIASLY